MQRSSRHFSLPLYSQRLIKKCTRCTANSLSHSSPFPQLLSLTLTFRNEENHTKLKKGRTGFSVQQMGGSACGESHYPTPCTGSCTNNIIPARDESRRPRLSWSILGTKECRWDCFDRRLVAEPVQSGQKGERQRQQVASARVDGGCGDVRVLRGWGHLSASFSRLPRPHQPPAPRE